MTVASILTPAGLLTATAGLIAFHIGLLTLVGRERKSPYVINSVLPIFLLCLFVVAISLVAALVSPLVAFFGYSLPPLMKYAFIDSILYAGGWSLTIAVLWSFYHVYRIAIRFVYFIDSINPRHLPVIRHARRYWEMRHSTPTYAHNPIPFPSPLAKELVDTLRQLSQNALPEEGEKDLRSLAVVTDYQSQSNKLLATLALTFLHQKFSVQYMSASRHPIQFIEHLRAYAVANGHTWQTLAKQIVVIDAYSPHFAFIDSIYEVKTRALAALDVTCINSSMTYAGMHSASTSAFQAIRKQMGRDYRQPTLVIYEDSYALSDL